MKPFNQVYRGVVAILTCLACLTLVSCSNSNEKANKLFIESVTLLKDAEQLLSAYGAGVSGTPEIFISKFDMAMKDIDRIITKYPQSDIAVKLIQGEYKLNGRELSDYQSRVIKITEAYQSAVTERGSILRTASQSPGNYALALVTLTGMPFNKYENTFSVVATMLAKAGKYSEALNFIDDKIKNSSKGNSSQQSSDNIPASYLAEMTGNVAIEMLKKGATNEALRLLETMQLASNRAQRDEQTQEKLDYIYASLAESAAKQGSFDEAIRFSKLVASESIRSSALADIAGASPDLRHIKALQTLALTIEEPLPKCRAQSAIFVACITNGVIELSGQLLNEALTSGRSETNANLRCCALNELAQAIIKTKGNPADVINESLLAAGMLTEEEWMPWKSIQLRNIAETVAMSGDIDRAVELVNNIDAMQKRVALTRIADQCAKLGMKERAVKISEMVLNSPLKSPIDSPDLMSAGILARAAEQLSLLGQQQRARMALEETVNSWGPAIAAESAKGTNRNIQTAERNLIEILAQLAAQGNSELALNWAGKIKYCNPYEGIATALIKVGKVDEAVAVVHRSLQQEDAFYNVARELAEHGHELEALKLMEDLQKSNTASQLPANYVWMMVNVLNEYKAILFSKDEAEIGRSVIDSDYFPMRRDWCYPFVK